MKLFVEKCFYLNFIKKVKCILKVSKSLYIAKSRQRYYKTFNNMLLHVPNHALKDVSMLYYGTIQKYKQFLLDRLFYYYFFDHIISSKHTHLDFWTFSRVCPTIFE